MDGGLARVTRQLLLSGDDPAARLRALMPLELGIFGLGDLAQPVLVRDFLNTLTLMSGHAYPAAVLRHHAYYLLRAASFSRRSFGLGHLEAALDVLASSQISVGHQLFHEGKGGRWARDREHLPAALFDDAPVRGRQGPGLCDEPRAVQRIVG